MTAMYSIIPVEIGIQNHDLSLHPEGMISCLEPLKDFNNECVATEEAQTIQTLNLEREKKSPAFSHVKHL